MSNLNFLFESWPILSTSIKFDMDKAKYVCTIRLDGEHKGYGVFSTGEQPEIALVRACESLEHAERWRRLKY